MSTATLGDVSYRSFTSFRMTTNRIGIILHEVKDLYVLFSANFE